MWGQPRARHVTYSLWIIIYYSKWITQHSVLFRLNNTTFYIIQYYSLWITLNVVLFTLNNTWLFRVNMLCGALSVVLTFAMKFEFLAELSCIYIHTHIHTLNLLIERVCSSHNKALAQIKVNPPCPITSLFNSIIMAMKPVSKSIVEGSANLFSTIETTKL